MFVCHSGKKRKPSIKRTISRFDVGNQARLLLSQFVHDRMQSDGFLKAPTSEVLIEPGTPSGEQNYSFIRENVVLLPTRRLIITVVFAFSQQALWNVEIIQVLGSYNIYTYIYIYHYPHKRS